MALDKSKIKLVDYDLYVEGIGKVGYLVRAQTKANPGAQYTRVENAAQFLGVLKAWKIGDAPTLTTTLLQVDFNVLFGELGSGQFPEIVGSGGEKSYGLGNKIKDLETVGVFIRLHPTDADDDDFSSDIAFWKASPDFSNVEISGDLNNAQTVTVPWIIMPDETKSSDEAFGRIGDWSVVDGTPLGVFVQFGQYAQKPYKHVPAITLASKAKKRAYAYALKAGLTTTTGQINQTGGITATTQTFNVDTLPPNHPIGAGDYIKINNEVMEITGATVVSATEKTFTVVRAIGGTTAAAHADNDTVTLLKNVAIQRGTEKATWASSAVTIATVGNSNALQDKGLISWVSAGSANITAQVNTVTSPNVAVTTQT